MKSHIEIVEEMNRAYPGYAFFDVPEWIKICQGGSRLPKSKEWRDPMTGKRPFISEATAPMPQHLNGNKHNAKPVLAMRGNEVVGRFDSRKDLAELVDRDENTVGWWIKTGRVVDGIHYINEEDNNV